VIETMGSELRERTDMSLEAMQDAMAHEGCRYLKDFFAAE
jgi:hypothetical protein